MRRSAARTAAPMAMQNQLSRLFGATSAEARKVARSPSEWKNTLRKVLHEISRYISANIDTHELHSLVIASGLCTADESLKNEDFWPGYAEGLTRVILALLGDYPDHHRRKGGGKASDHYRLQLYRSLQYAQNSDQRFRTLLASGIFGLLGLSRPPQEVSNEFRSRFGNEPSWRQFLGWYRKHFPGDYTAVFSRDTLIDSDSLGEVNDEAQQ